MTKSNTKIKKQTVKKTNPEIVETINLARKNKKYITIAELLSRPRSQRIEFNLNEINNLSSNNNRILVAGKVLSQGEIDKKIDIIALNISKNAKEKLLKSGCKISSIIDEIKNNPECSGITILKNENN